MCFFFPLELVIQEPRVCVCICVCRYICQEVGTGMTFFKCQSGEKLIPQRHSFTRRKKIIFRVSHSERKIKELTYTYTFLVKTHIFLNSRGIENCTAFYSPNFAKIRKGLCYQIEVLLIHHFCSKSGQEIIQFYGRTIQPIEREGTGQNHKTVGSV